jgi:hypothetical protein
MLVVWHHMLTPLSAAVLHRLLSHSLSIAVWEVFTNRQAYQGLHYGAVVERVVIQKQRPPVPEDMPDEYSLLMSSCWDAEPNNRPSFSQIATCLEIMIDNLTNEAENAAHQDDVSGAYVQHSSSAAAAAGSAARFAASTNGGSSDQVAVVVSGANSSVAAGAGGSTGGSNASAWQQQQQQRLVLPVPILPPVAIAARASTGSQHSGQHVVVLTPTQLQQQRVQGEASAAAGQDRGSAGQPAATAAAGGSGASHVTPHTTHSTGSQLFASGANVLDSNQYLQDL